MDDGNWEDHHIQFCIDYAKEKGDTEGAELAQILLHMSPRQQFELAYKVGGCYYLKCSRCEAYLEDQSEYQDGLVCGDRKP